MCRQMRAGRAAGQGDRRRTQVVDHALEGPHALVDHRPDRGPRRERVVDGRECVAGGDELGGGDQRVVGRQRLPVPPVDEHVQRRSDGPVEHDESLVVDLAVGERSMGE